MIPMVPQQMWQPRPTNVPPPKTTPDTPPQEAGPERWQTPERMRIRAAAFRATRLYPGPVGELLSKELFVWDEFGYRLGAHSLIVRLVDHVLQTPLPGEGGAA